MSIGYGRGYGYKSVIAMPGKRSKNNVLDTTRKIKQEKALAYRLAGMTYAQIGSAISKEFDCKADRGSAWRLVDDAVTEQIEKNLEAAEKVRLFELNRLDKLLSGVWAKAIKGDDKAVLSAIRLMDRRSKYLGLDAPAKNESVVTDEEIRLKAKELGVTDAAELDAFVADVRRIEKEK